MIKNAEEDFWKIKQRIKLDTKLKYKHKNCKISVRSIEDLKNHPANMLVIPARENLSEAPKHRGEDEFMKEAIKSLGKTHKKELDHILKSRGPVRSAEVVTINECGELPYDTVMHAVTPIYDSGVINKNKYKKTMKHLIAKILDTVVNRNLGKHRKSIFSIYLYSYFCLLPTMINKIYNLNTFTI